MNFKKATNALFSRIDHETLAEALGVSVALIRQARLTSSAEAHRSPPPGWESAVSRLAAAQARHFQALTRKVRGR